jgi:hypothetical protein
MAISKLLDAGVVPMLFWMCRVGTFSYLSTHAPVRLPKVFRSFASMKTISIRIWNYATQTIDIVVPKEMEILTQETV